MTQHLANDGAADAELGAEVALHQPVARLEMKVDDSLAHLVERQLAQGLARPVYKETLSLRRHENPQLESTRVNEACGAASRARLRMYLECHMIMGDVNCCRDHASPEGAERS